MYIYIKIDQFCFPKTFVFSGSFLSIFPHLIHLMFLLLIDSICAFHLRQTHPHLEICVNDGINFGHSLHSPHSISLPAYPSICFCLTENELPSFLFSSSSANSCNSLHHLLILSAIFTLTHFAKIAFCYFII